MISASLASLSDNFKVVRRNVIDASYPWNQENSPVEIKTKAVTIPFWVLYNGSAGPLPYSEQYQLKTEDPVEITLIPYGCTTLRISQFPVVRVYQKNEKMNLSGL